MSYFTAAATLLMLSSACTTALGQAFTEPCARTDSFPRPAVRGPFDYRYGHMDTRRMVESNHFAPFIENLQHGRTGTLAQELSFVLHGFPNHHRALASLIRWAERDKSNQPGKLDYTVDCYFQRALVFRPDDLIVRMLFADHLIRRRQEKDAAAQLEYVVAAAPDNPFTQYNVGLLYTQMGRYPEALIQAHRAIALGSQRTALKEKLKAQGQWQEPVEMSDSAASASER